MISPTSSQSPERDRGSVPSRATYIRRRTIAVLVLASAAYVAPKAIGDWITRMPDTTPTSQGNPAGAALDAAIQEQIQKGYSPADGDRLLGSNSLGDRGVSTINGAMEVDARQADIDFRPQNDNTDGKAAHWSQVNASEVNPNPQPNDRVISWMDCGTEIGRCTVLAAFADSSSDSPTPTSTPLPPGQIEELLVPKQQQML